MPGRSGRELKAAYAKSNTWGVPASVTRQISLQSMEGIDSQPAIVDDEAFNQEFLQPGEVADHNPVTPELTFQARYENVDVWIAMAMGSAANPVVVSSGGGGGGDAHQHVLTLATFLTQYLTLAVDYTNFVVEVPSLKLAGYNMRVGENGRMLIGFPIVGARVNYDSTVNTNSTVAGAAAAELGNRLFRKDGRFRMNVQSAAGLGAADELAIIKEISLGGSRPLAQDDFVFNQDFIIEPDDDGFPEFPLEVTYARMQTPSANSLVAAIQAARVFKADWFFQGPFINSSTRRSALWEFPALQIRNIRIAAAGPGQVRPVATFHMKKAAAAPTGMDFTLPYRVTLVNANSQNLLA